MQGVTIHFSISITWVYSVQNKTPNTTEKEQINMGTTGTFWLHQYKASKSTVFEYFERVELQQAITRGIFKKEEESTSLPYHSE